MAHHQQSNHNRTLAAQGLSSGNATHGAANQSTSGDDELAADVDEPPDRQIHFAKLVSPTPQSLNSEYGNIMSQHTQRGRKESLLTQALLSSPELTPVSDVEAPVLTSDGGMTSPARTTTPSPPLPALSHPGLTSLVSKEDKSIGNGHAAEAEHLAQTTYMDRSRETKVEEGLGRRRCISFACGRQEAQPKQIDSTPKPLNSAEVSSTNAAPPKRPCMLRFACPMRPSRTETLTSSIPAKSTDLDEPRSLPLGQGIVKQVPDSSPTKHASLTSASKISALGNDFTAIVATKSRKAQAFNRVDFQKFEATRFCEFAGPFNAEDEWTNELTAHRHKITINDTLRKENAIRRLAEEAEEEALEEEAEKSNGYDNGEELNDEDNAEQEEDDEEVSDGGNETDNEEGFADSEDESDCGSDYRFWTPGLTTAATSTDHIEHIRPISRRVGSDSSIDSVIDAKDPPRPRKEPHISRSHQMRPATPDLPDSTDFVIGTLDEDQPLEDAYMSCLERRRQSKRKLIPQDIDPSFPTSDPEADVEDYNEEADTTQVENKPEWVTGRPESSEDEHSNLFTKSTPSKKSANPPLPSPKTHHSPPPPKRSVMHRSPPPRRLFGQPTHRLRSPPPIHRKLASPPSSRRPSVSESPCNGHYGIDTPHLAQRPNLTHTTSLPRTPNPFWGQQRMSRFHGCDSPSSGTSPKTMNPMLVDNHSRGPIDIVQGLEAKRQRRRDKFWRLHCRNAGKDKERRCQPGKGAERMKELGLEMADRCKSHGQKAQLVLSV